MKTRIKSIISIILSTVLCFIFVPSTRSNAWYEWKSTEEYLSVILSQDFYNQEIDWTLWDKFLKYDLCITDYDALTAEEQELCKFIFETERSASGTVRCERARRTLAGDDIGERVELTDIIGMRCIIDPAFTTPKGIYNKYVLSIPDIIHLDYNLITEEYWIDNEGTKKIIFDGCLTNFIYLEYGAEITEKPEYFAELNYDAEAAVNYATLEFDETLISENLISGDWEYILLPDNTAAIYLYNREFSNETLTVPDNIDGCTVSRVFGDFNDGNFKSIILPENMKYLASDLLRYNLTVEQLKTNSPEAVIGKHAFTLSALKTADITAKTIEEYAFYECALLEEVLLNEEVESIEAFAFSECQNLTHIDIPSTVKVIGQGAFSDTAINEVTIPETVEIIGAIPVRCGSKSESIPATDPLTDEPVCAFDSDCIINGWYNTEAHWYALEWGLKFNPMDEDIAYGDTNLDGEINIADMVLLQSYLTGNVSEIGYEADMLSDGIVDSFDMIKMRSSVLAYS